MHTLTGFRSGIGLLTAGKREGDGVASRGKRRLFSSAVPCPEFRNLRSRCRASHIL